MFVFSYYFASVKKLFAYLFVVVLLFSVLPVREIGKLLGKSQTTEEVHNDDLQDDDADFSGKIKKEIDPFVSFTYQQEDDVLISYNHKIEVAIHGASILPDHYIPRIPTPPPNIG